MIKKEQSQTGYPEPKIEIDKIEDWWLVAIKDAKKKIGGVVESMEEISKIRANEYLGCNCISDEKKRNFINFIKFTGEIKDVLNH